MARYSDERRKESTIRRDENVHRLYGEIMSELGELGTAVSRTYIYDRISDKTGLCGKTIAFILNHTVL